MQHLDNGGEDTVHILQHFVVPEPQHTIAFGFEPRRSFVIVETVPPFSVLAAIQFDDQTKIEVDEVDGVGVKSDLVPELLTFDLSSTQTRPQSTLGFSLVAP